MLGFFKRIKDFIFIPNFPTLSLYEMLFLQEVHYRIDEIWEDFINASDYYPHSGELTFLTRRVFIEDFMVLVNNLRINYPKLWIYVKVDLIFVERFSYFESIYKIYKK